MNIFRPGLTALTLMVTSSVAPEQSPANFCKIWSPDAEPPKELSLIYEHIPYLEVVDILGELGYSPTDGQYYYSTGGRCSLPESGGRDASCGFVLEFRDYDRMIEMDPIRPGDRPRYRAFLPADKTDWRLQSCSWGGIGE